MVAGESRRDLIYRMRVDTEQAKKEWAKTGQSVRGFYAELRKLEAQQRAVDEVMTGLGTGMVASGAAIGVGLGLAAKAAIEWESAWTGVVKVVDGTPEQLASLEGELRDLATTLPQTHAEIAGVAAAAGQLGIARKDIAQFTEVMVAMGVSTDLASEDAAMSMARLMNIMQSAPGDVDNLGSAIVGLGNSGASTEAEIVEMALRIAGAGKTVGMTEADVLGFASALASVGIEAESGGSSISTAMVKMAEAVNEGGDTLAEFANVAGVSADEFAAKFRTDPAQAIDMFVQGLGRIQDSGGDVFGVLEGLGMSEIRLRDAMLRLAGAGDLLTDSLATGNQAWDENAALMEEAARRYGTTEAQIQIARNQLTDMGITLGERLLPAIRSFLDTGQGMFAWFNDLSDGTQSGIVVLGTIATVIGVVGGAALIAAPKLNAMSLALGEMGTKGAGRASTALSKLSNFMLSPWGAAVGTAVAVFGMFVAQQAEARAKTEQLTDTLDRQTGAVTEGTRAFLANELQMTGAFDTADQLGISQADLVDAILSGNDAIVLQNEKVLELAENSSDLSDEEKVLVQDAQELRMQILDLNGTYADSVDAAENRRAAIEGESGATAAASTENQIYAESLGIATEYVDAATSANQEFDAALRALRDTMFGSKDAQAALTLEIERATEAFEENGSSLDVNTEAGALNHQAVMGLIAANHELIAAEAESGATAEELAETTDNLRGDFIDLMRQAGMSEDAIDDYADAFDDIPASKTTTLIQKLETVGQWNVPSSGILPQYAEGGLIGFPAGGMIRGPGTGTSDSILLMGSNGEFMVNAEATAKNRGLLEAINSGQTLHAAMKHAPGHTPNGPSPAGGGTVRVLFDFSNVGDDFARAIKKTVRDNGNGIVQDTFGSS